MQKIIVSFPPGGGGRCIYLALEILLGEADSLSITSTGSTHHSTNNHLAKYKHDLSQHALPFLPTYYHTDPGEAAGSKPWNAEDYSDKEQYGIINCHLSTDEIQNNMDILSDWRVLKMDCNTNAEGYMIASLKMLKFRMPMQLDKTIADRIEHRDANIKHIVRLHKPIHTTVPSNIIQVSYFDFWNDPIPILLQLVDNISAERIELCRNELTRYWDLQNSSSSVEAMRTLA